MNTHEYQAMMVLRKYGVPVPNFAVLKEGERVEGLLEKLGLDAAVLKAQVHAGGRGKAGGVKIAKSREEAITMARQMLGMKIVNQQTGPRGVIAEKLLIAAPVKIQKEFYLGVTINREIAKPILIASPAGGMDIEEVAEKTPEKILKLPLALNGALRDFQLIRLCKFMGWEGDIAKQGRKVATALCQVFVEADASLLEVNPLVETEKGKLVAIDAKLSIDDNALFRQPELSAFYDPKQRSEHEAQAKVYDLAYVELDGDIGCMVNGAGLAMATMDIIQYYGGMPANFLDVGGGASQEKVAEGFKLVLSDTKVKALLVNIFGGIMNCVTLAAGIIAAASEQEVHVPLVVRLEGTNVEQGRQMLHDAGLNIIIANGLTDAAQKAVAAAQH